MQYGVQCAAPVQCAVYSASALCSEECQCSELRYSATTALQHQDSRPCLVCVWWPERPPNTHACLAPCFCCHTCCPCLLPRAVCHVLMTSCSCKSCGAATQPWSCCWSGPWERWVGSNSPEQCADCTLALQAAGLRQFQTAVQHAASQRQRCRQAAARAPALQMGNAAAEGRNGSVGPARVHRKARVQRGDDKACAGIAARCTALQHAQLYAG